MALFLPRQFRRQYLRPRPLFLIITFLVLLDALIISVTLPSPVRTTPEGYSKLPSQRIFIASINRNSEYMLRMSWSAALLDLVKHLGPENVYVSVVESGSQDHTKEALTDLRGELDTLGVKNTIFLGIDVLQQAAELLDVPVEGEDRTGWIFSGRGKTGWEVRRIPYLANLRNQAMEPLLAMSPETRFDKVLWINDVVFTTEDVTTLLATNQGSYAAACSLDFSRPVTPQIYYDTFALRDSLGHKTATLTYPYFYSASSLSALRSNSPVPVKSCWNGMIAMDSAPFYSSPPLRFRGTTDDLAKEHVEGSECCLVHADNWRLGAEKGVWLNPNVRVSYNLTTYENVNPGAGREGSPGVEGRQTWPGKWEAVGGIWRNRRARWFGWVRDWSEATVVRGRVRRWIEKGKVLGEEREERGAVCLVNEMQVLFENGWQHV
ncbi:hypothetical protein D0Z07_5770 [Hyphodiscus hymeniophilus]|uniref:Polysaccharide export protein n=1 Tax=Hyphodiscus hymeniophilus TaxID=353542 RepID=A0A9P6VHG6_9HELO|nr:hypothetical protein D0Z07_5770 [Hyphodiscus hymeniophilus]